LHTHEASKAVEPQKIKLPDTDEALEKRRRDIAISMGWEKPQKPPEIPVGAEKKNETSAAPPEPPAGVATPAAETPPAPPVVTPAPIIPASSKEDLDTEALIAKTAKAVGVQVGQAIADAKSDGPAAVEPEPVPAAELTPEDQRDLATLQKMEEMNPASRGKADEFKKFALARYDYETAWRERNPGREFSPDDADHEEFYKQQPEINQVEFEAAKIEMIVERKVQERVDNQVTPVLKRISAEKAFETARPLIERNVVERVHEAVKQVSEDLAKIIHDGQRVNLSQENIDKFKASDPISARVLDPMITKELMPMIFELEKTVATGLDYQLDPQRNPVHARIADYVRKFESEMITKPEARDGKEFLTIEQRNAAVQVIVNGKGTQAAKEQKIQSLDARHWTATVDDIEAAIVADISKRAKAEIEELDGLARAKYRPETPKGAAEKPAEVQKPVETIAPAVAGKPRPPAVDSQTTVVDSTRVAANGNKSFGETAVATHWGR
jgi:hypothetical protein